MRVIGKSSPAPPAAPDPVVTAQAQTASNVETARANATLNRVNQYTPQGTLTYKQATSPAWNEAAYLAANPDVAAEVGTQGGFKSGQEQYAKYGINENRQGVTAGYDPNAADKWTATTTYSPEQQRLYDLSTQAQTQYGEAGLAQLGKLRDQMSTPFAFQGAPDYAQSVGPDDFSADRTAVEAALYGRLDPSLSQARSGLEAKLRNQGLAPGSEAWTNAMRDQSQTENDARLAVTGAGLQEQQGLFGMAQSQGNYNRQTRQQMLAEQLAIRNQPLNETSALLTGSQVQVPQFQGVPGVQQASADVTSGYGTQYAARNAAYQGQVATNNANTGAAAGTAAAAVSAAAVII